MAIGTPTLVGTIDAATSGGGEDVTFNFPGAIAAGTVILIAANGVTAGTIDSITDSRGNTYTVDATKKRAGSSISGHIASGVLTTAIQASDVLTISISGFEFVFAKIYSVTGLTTSPFDKSAVADDNFTVNFTSGNTAATAQADELLFGVHVTDAEAATFTAGGSFAELDDAAGTTTSCRMQTEYQIVAATGTYAATATCSGANDGVSLIATYKGVSSGLTDSTPEIAVGNATESIRTATTDPYTFSHTPDATPRGIVLTAIHGVSSTDHIVSVTYGGVAMTRVSRATDTATEPGAAEIWFLGSGIPTGIQTVSIDLSSATTDDFQFLCITLTTNDGSDTEAVDTDGVSENVANPSVTLQYNGRQAVAIGAFYGGGASPADFAPNANCTTVDDHDLGAFYAEVIKQTTPGFADFAIGGTSLTDDVAFAAAAFANAHHFRAAGANMQDPAVV